MVVLRKRDGGSNRKWCGGSDDVFPFSSQTQSEPNLASAFPSTGEMTLQMESRLSAFTVMIRFIISSDVMCSDLWGKEARNNSAILRAWDELSQFRTMIVKILEVVEFIEALESVDGMCAARGHPAIKNDSLRRRGLAGFQKLRGTAHAYKDRACPLCQRSNLKARTAGMRCVFLPHCRWLKLRR